MKKGCIGLIILVLVLQLVSADDNPYPADSQGLCSGADGVKIGGDCFDCGKNDGICPDDFSSGACTTADVDCCQVTAVKWTDASGSEITSANGGDSVKLVVETAGKCSGQSVSFDIWEADQFTNDDYTSDPSSSTIGSDGKASASWIADGDFGDGVLGNPEYIFNALIGNVISYGPSSELAVSGSGGASGTPVDGNGDGDYNDPEDDLDGDGIINSEDDDIDGDGTPNSSDSTPYGGTGGCGDGILDSGETPESCASDAGCDNGYVYCGSDEGCQLTCASNANDNGDGTCDADESCSATACDGLQSTCLNGLMCGSGVCSCNTNAQDGIFPPPTSSCASVDPDYDFDGDTFMANDNCPLVANADQSDSDADTSSCSFALVPYVNSNGFSCGGDLCDLDDDNDGVCDIGEASTECVGSDLCPGTSAAVDLSAVDENGCTEDQKNCLVQWDCTQAVWSECDVNSNTITRDTSLCQFTGPEGSVCQTDPAYQPESTKSCLVEEEFPVFSFLNIIITLVLIFGFYFIRR